MVAWRADGGRSSEPESRCEGAGIGRGYRSIDRRVTRERGMPTGPTTPAEPPISRRTFSLQAALAPAHLQQPRPSQPRSVPFIITSVRRLVKHQRTQHRPGRHRSAYPARCPTTPKLHTGQGNASSTQQLHPTSNHPEIVGPTLPPVAEHPPAAAPCVGPRGGSPQSLCGAKL